ncbi:hypothetical protein [Actinacidiphila acidipaludis]|uniref:Histone protein n=1 Tax=Actinacidiphila acidipaludis TaxID=2873382 RepID=A0ABS7QGC5_9ACTN|nr:hypothetical protein [Streptomyces acidipaludis]MBY8882221.1 hypothetical protein [Streptomyces acidipaludis]
MDTGKAAAAVTGGYLLGRFRKARWALVLAGAVAGRQLRSNGRGGTAAQLLKSPEIGKLTGNLRGQLASAGKAAAVAATARQMDALSDRLAERTEALRAGPDDSSEESDEDEADATEPEEDEDEAEDQEEDEDQQEEEQPEDEEQEGRKRAPARKRAPSRTAARKSTAAKKAPAKKQGASGGAARKKASGPRPSGSAAKKKTASGGEARKRTARKSSASSRAGGRGKE